MPEKEEALIACIVWMADHGFPLSRPIIKFSHQGTIVHIEKALSESGWVLKLATRTPDSLDRARIHGVAAEVLDGFFSLYEGLVATYSILKERPDLIFNCD